MRKTKFLTLALITCLLLTFVGCGQSNVPEITKTAETFLKAAADADYETVSVNCTETALSEMGLEPLDPAYNSDGFFEGLALDKSAFGEAAIASVDDFGKYYSEALIQNYSIIDVTEKDGVGSVTATITTYSAETLSALSGEDFQSELTTLLTDYQNENLNDLSAIYLNEGEDAMMIKIFDDLMPDIMDIMRNLLDGFTTEEVKLTLIVEKVDEKWIVTGATVLE